MEDLTNQNKKLHEQKKSIKNNLQLFGNKVSANESITLDAANLSKTNSVARTDQTEYRNLRKRLFTELNGEAGQSSQSSEDKKYRMSCKTT